MPITVKTLRVLANPWVHNTVDHRGRPAGRLPVEPLEFSQPVTFVGCKMVDVVEEHPAQTFAVGNVVVETARPRHDHRFAYSKTPVEVPNTDYYCKAIACGDLVAADAKTARAAGIVFVEPEKFLAKARQEAIAHFNATTGDDAHAEMAKIHEHDGEPLWLPSAEEQASSAANRSIETTFDAIENRAQSAGKNVAAKTNDPKGSA